MKLTEDNKRSNDQPLSISSTATNTHGQTFSPNNQPSNFRDKTITTAGIEQSLIASSCTAVTSFHTSISSKQYPVAGSQALPTGKQNSHDLVRKLYAFLHAL